MKRCILMLAAIFVLAGACAPAGDEETIEYEYYVNMDQGSDANDGTSPSSAFKTITHALAVAGTGMSIKVAPGDYTVANGESFPLVLDEGQSLVGDIANKGNGATATLIACTNDTATTFSAANSCIGMATGSSVRGFLIQNTIQRNYVFGVYNASASGTVISDNSLGSNLYGGIYGTTGAMTSERNAFDVGSYAYYLGISDNPSIQINANSISANTSIPFDISGAGSLTHITNNTVTGSNMIGAQILNGNPVLMGNTFNNSSGYDYGAIRCINASPAIRQNTFICITAIVIGNGDAENSQPSMGDAGNPGGNDFSAVTGNSIVVSANTNITDFYAIGNTWPGGTPPDAGDISIADTGDKVYYTATDYVTK